VLDSKNKILYLNDTAKRLTGIKNEPQNQYFDQIFIITHRNGDLFELPFQIKEEFKIDESYILILKNNNRHDITINIKNVNGFIEGGEKLIVLEDITYKSKYEILLKKEKVFSKSIIENSEMFVFVIDMSGIIISLNKYAYDKIGFTPDEVIGKEFIELFGDKEEKESINKLINEINQNEFMLTSFEKSIESKNKNKIDVLWKNSFLKDDNNLVYSIVFIGMDISEMKLLEKEMKRDLINLSKEKSEFIDVEENFKKEYANLKNKHNILKLSEERFRLAVESSNDGVWDYDIKNNRMYFSSRWKEILGYNINEIDDKYETWINLIHLDDASRFIEEVEGHLKKKDRHFNFELRLKTKKNDYKWLLCRGIAISDENGNPSRLSGSISDISERKIFEEKINKLAYYDNVTGLPNRLYLFEKLGLIIEEAKNNNTKGALIFLDLDNFKTINDTLGHSFGDELLKKVGNMIQKITKMGDLVAHFGADEFVIVKPDIDIDLANEIANDVVRSFQKPWMVDDRDYFITASAGVVIFPDDGNDVQTILKNVDMAMYNAKDFGKNKYQIYRKDMNKVIINKLETHNDLRYAIERDEFLLFYQPQIDIKTGKIVSVEALIRWLKPSAGIIQPMKFVPMAEESGLIVQIGEWVLKTACEQINTWKKMGIPSVNIAVNFSAKQFQLDNITSMVENVITQSNMNPKFLEVEITESIIMENMEYTTSVLKDLRKMGIKVSLDDFGTGYSSLNYLKKLPIDMLKIDKSFVNELSTGKDEQAIAKAVIELAHSMRLVVTAEGVETVEQLEFLKKYNCDKVQGYLFSKPVPACELEVMLKKQGSLIDDVINSSLELDIAKK
ncbi:MAG: EAL domain-containing protein, partial [Clostridiales bacterium]